MEASVSPRPLPGVEAPDAAPDAVVAGHEVHRSRALPVLLAMCLIAALAVPVAYGIGWVTADTSAKALAATPTIADVPAIAPAPTPTPADAVTPLPGEPHIAASNSLRTEHGSVPVEDYSNTTIQAEVTVSPSGRTILKTGGMAAAFGFDRSMQTAVVSDAQQVAFMEPLGEGRTIYAPGGRSSSSIIVVDLATTPGEQVSEFRLDGNVVPEAFTSDGAGLFVIDHQPPLDPTTYRVQLLDLATGERFAVPGPVKQPAPEDMAGTGRRHVGTADGTFLFTLYTRQPAHHDGSTHVDHVHGFVHALALDESWALCIDLPSDFGRGAPETAAIAVSTDDERMFVVDGEAAAIAIFDVDDIKAVSNPAEFVAAGPRMPQPEVIVPLPLEISGTLSAMGTDVGVWIASGDEVMLLDLAGTTVLAHHRAPGPVDLLGIDENDQVYAAIGDRLVPLDHS